MTHTITVLDGIARIEVSFTDEGVDLTGLTHVKGGEAEALAYLPIFEADLRRNFFELFPPPPMPEGGMMP
jgi:hypothetical protein